MQILLDKLKEISGGKVLDVATGRGNFVYFLAQGLHDFEAITGIDYISDNILGQVKAKFEDERISFKHMDACKLDYSDNTFDTVSLSNSLHHLEDMQSVLKEIMRVLKKDGTFILNEMICDNQTSSQMTYVLMHHWWAKIDMDMGKLHYETFSWKKVMDIVAGLGLSSFEVSEFNDPDDPFDKESLDNINKIIDEYIEKAKPLPKFEAYRQEGEEIREHLMKFGVNGATQLIIIGKK